MNKDILAQIENINKSLAWIKNNKAADYNQKFLLLVEERRKLKKLYRACLDNPAVAAYGVSQVGKSYLMNCLLQKDGKPFLMEADGRTYNFIEEMNPKTTNTEATGVVTRFSSFSRDKGKYSKEYPILMRCLSIIDIILIISDGYYNDISDFTTPSESEINDSAKDIYSKYINRPIIKDSPLSPDSIMDMHAYFKKHINNAQAFLKTSLFDQLALVADRIPESDWVEVFSILWDKTNYQTRLFRKMLGTLSKFGFSEYVYLPPQALLHDGINENTVMSVQCLNELFLDRPKYFTDAYVRHRDGYNKVEGLTKSEVCAVCAEIIVKIGDEYLENTSRYSFANITDEKVKSVLSQGRQRIEKSNGDVVYETTVGVLKSNDMLDFPGARSRKKERLCTLKEDAILINVLLRGKVAYLFNLYNESMLINILLFCHHGSQNDVTDIPLMLNDWIKNYVGSTMEKRQKTLDTTDGISPLFYIGTKFNMDMELSTEDIQNGLNALKGRWQQRFEKVLYHQCFNADGSLDNAGVKIFLNWTKKGESFKNSYILRDFKFSGPRASKLYDRENTDERVMTIPESHYKNLRDTFCASEHVQRFFTNPELSWDVCSSIDNDGAQYIISQLAKVASCMSKTRKAQFEDILREVTVHINNLLQPYYISTNVDKILEANIRKAKSILREMDFTCNSDNYYFGHLIQALQLGEKDSYRIVHEVMHGPEINEQVNDFKSYEIILNTCERSGNSLHSLSSDDEKWTALIKTYGFCDRQEADEYLTKKHVDPKMLFSGNFKRKLNSYVVADAVYDHWHDRIKSVEFLNEFSDDESFDTTIMTTLVDNLLESSEAVDIKEHMATSIADYVNVVSLHNVNETLLADLLASHINEFVLDFGFKYLSDDEKEKAHTICEERKLPSFNYIREDPPALLSEIELTALFNEMTTNPKDLLPSFEHNYNKWKEYMFVSFVAHLDVPKDFNKEANDQLEVLLQSICPG